MSAAAPNLKSELAPQTARAVDRLRSALHNRRLECRRLQRVAERGNERLALVEAERDEALQESRRVLTLVRDLTGEYERTLYRACAYCGSPCYGLACHGHRDLLALDPNYGAL